MIAKVKGKLVDIEGSLGSIETASGITYVIYLTPHLLTEHKLNSPIDIETYLQVKEDDMILYGFESKDQRALFKMLISVSGVGPKTAYGIISFSKEGDLYEAIRENNVDYFSKIPGLGKKTAMKIILEISSRLKSEFQMEKMHMSEEDKTVVDALISLGFKAQEAKSILQKLPKNLSIEEKIREGLRFTSKTNG